VYDNTDGWMLLARRKLSLIRWLSLLSLELYTQQQTQKEELSQAHLFNVLTTEDFSLTSGQVEFVSQKSFEIPASDYHEQKDWHLVRNIAWYAEKFVYLKLIYPVHKLLNFLNWKQKITRIHCKKRLAIFPAPAGMSLTKLSLAGNNWMSLAKLSLAGNN
jgi:hypothetical protein